MKNPIDSDLQQSGLLLGSEPLDEVRHRGAYAKAADDDKGDFADGDTGDDDGTDADGTDSDTTDSKDADGKD